MLTDTTAYTADRVLTSVTVAKATPLVSLPAAISCTGNSVVHRSVVRLVETEFSSFDDLIQDGAGALRDVFAELAGRGLLDTFSTAQAFLVGWHREENRPGTYALTLEEDGSPPTFEDVSANVTGTPLPTKEALKRCGFVLKPRDGYDESTDLLHLMEVARHRENIDAGVNCVGGQAVLTTVTRDSLTQRVLHQWPDVVGELIEPVPIDWAAWRKTRGHTATASVNVEGLSRLQRKRILKKARKGTLR